MVVHLVESIGYTGMRAACGYLVPADKPNSRTGANRFVTCQKCRGTVRFQRNRARNEVNP